MVLGSGRLLARGACAVLGGGLAVYAAGAGEGVVCASAAGAKHLDPWIERWKVNKTSWHVEAPHKSLVKFSEKLLPTGKEAVFFPLCGKTVDMPFLASAGHAVVGVDCAVEAREQTIADQNAKVVGTSSAGGFTTSDLDVNGARFKYVVGDYFSMTPATAGTFDAAFDRGSLVAIDPPMREGYAATLGPLIKPAGKILLVTVYHDPFADGRLGPPFSVEDSDVKRLFSDSFTVEMLHEEDNMLGEQRGCTFFKERVYLLTKKAGFLSRLWGA